MSYKKIYISKDRKKGQLKKYTKKTRQKKYPKRENKKKMTEVYCLFKCRLCKSDVVVKGALSRNCLHSDLMLVARPQFFFPLGQGPNFEHERIRLEAELRARGVPGWSTTMRPPSPGAPKPPNWRFPFPPRSPNMRPQMPTAPEGHYSHSLNTQQGASNNITPLEPTPPKRQRKTTTQSEQKIPLPPFADFLSDTSIPTTVNEVGPTKKCSDQDQKIEDFF